MRVHLSDGTREVEITARTLLGARRLAYMAAVLLDRIREQTDTDRSDDGADDDAFGFTLDRVSLDSSIERAEPYYDDRGEPEENEDTQQ